YLTGSAGFGAHIRTCTPVGKAGMFQGLRIVGQVLIPGIIGPAVGARILQNAATVVGDDGTVAFIPNQNIFLGALVVILLLLPLLFLFKKEKRNA
ncbi:MAG: MFS transporter, partial [Clostridia bacterium]|nr:MFS transporter [Clostridia bacterium]